MSDNAVGPTIGALACWGVVFGVFQIFQRRARISEFINRNQDHWFWRLQFRPRYIFGTYDQTIDYLTVTLLVVMMVWLALGFVLLVAAFPSAVPELFK